jgi:glutamine---fructose-6-phosphate transaminase (isomerizing)
MCGMVGYAGRRPALPILTGGLAHLECRAGDTAGVAVAAGSKLSVCEVLEPGDELASTVLADVVGVVGIAHTHWGLHGFPVDTVESDLHRAVGGRVAIVHDGTIENVDELQAKLEADGVELASASDSEVLAHLVTYELAREGAELEHAVGRAVAAIDGSYGLAAIDARQPDRIVVASHGSPVVIGLGNGENFVASGAFALASFSRQVFHLVDRELAVLSADRIRTSFVERRRPLYGVSTP